MSNISSKSLCVTIKPSFVKRFKQKFLYGSTDYAIYADKPNYELVRDGIYRCTDYDNSICFIMGTGEIFSHGRLFGSVSEIDEYIKSLETKLFADVNTKDSIRYIAKDEIDKIQPWDYFSKS